MPLYNPLFSDVNTSISLLSAKWLIAAFILVRVAANLMQSFHLACLCRLNYRFL